MRLSTTIAILALLIGGGMRSEAAAPPKPARNLKYVCIRPVSPTPSAKRNVPATANGKTVYYDPDERVLDLGGLKTVGVKAEPFGGYAITASLTPDAAKSFGAWTAAHLHEQVGIFVDDALVMAPIVQSRITDAIEVDGNYTREQAERIADRIRAGGAP
jgi:preprotein translocase subunit SecD